MPQIPNTSIIIYHSVSHIFFILFAAFRDPKKNEQKKGVLSERERSAMHIPGREHFMAAKKKAVKFQQQPDEIVVYIAPEENITSVRERLERIEAQQVALIVPPQTHLRGQLVWKLLYSRAKELGKDVSIVSSDPQVRAMASSVQFKVAS